MTNLDKIMDGQKRSQSVFDINTVSIIIAAPIFLYAVYLGFFEHFTWTSYLLVGMALGLPKLKLSSYYTLIIFSVCMYLTALTLPALYWESGKYANATCPDHIVEIRKLLGIGSPNGDARAILKARQDGDISRAQELFYQAEKQWGNRPEIRAVRHAIHNQ